MANTWTTLLDAVYPVGAVYQSWSSTSPATLFGGTWTQIANYFLRACGEDNEKAGETGGAKTHAHTAGELAAAIGSCNSDVGSIGFVSSNPTFINKHEPTYVVHGSSSSGGFFNHYTAVEGSTESASSYPPHIVCYMWRRTA